MPGRRHALLTHLVCALAVLTSAGLFMAAALVPAPPAVLPLVVVVCIGFPMLAVWELSATRGRTPLDSRSLARLRRHLDELPETPHPLGL
jgi:CHASE2 domain-containing sensor protein